MKDNLKLKHGLIKQSLSPVFCLLIIRHMHLDYLRLIRSFSDTMKINPWMTILKALNHPRFGELLIVVIGIMFVVSSLLSIPAFNSIQEAGFESQGEMPTDIEEMSGAAASFLVTFILPLLIDELSTPQKWISYLLVIVIVYAVLYQSNLYYQNPVLALMGYKVFSFKVKNPDADSGMKADKKYIGITWKTIITKDSAIQCKYISDDVFLVYNER